MFSKRYSARQLFGNFYKEAAPELFDRLRWQENNYFSLADQEVADHRLVEYICFPEIYPFSKKFKPDWFR